MSLTVSLDGQPLILQPGTSISMEWYSPLFLEDVLRSAYTYTFTLPLDENRQALGYPEVIENTTTPRRSLPGCSIEWSGQVLGTDGDLRILKLRATTVEVMVVFGLSRVARELSRALGSFDLGGPQEVPITVPVRGFDVPGLTWLAGETVHHPEEYDYVFAPFQNDTADLKAPGASQPPAVVNGWIYDADTLNLTREERGYFTFFTPFQVMGLPPQLPGAPNPGMTPLPRLPAVLHLVLQELGMRVVEDHLGTHPELSQLVIVSSHQAAYRWRMSDCMPDLTLKEFLLKLRSSLGLIVDTASTRARVLLLQTVLDDLTFDEWTGQVASTLDEMAIPDVTGCRLVYTIPEDEATTAAYQAAPGELPEGEEVDTAAELPATVPGSTTPEPQPEVRWVDDEQAFYASLVHYDYVNNVYRFTWTRAGGRYQPVRIGPSGQDVEQGITAMLETEYDYGTILNPPVRQVARMPLFTQKLYFAGHVDTERGKALRLAFYRGLQEQHLGFGHPLAADRPYYPQLSVFNYTSAGARLGDYSLQLDGENGTANRLLSDWLTLKAGARPVKWRVWLTPEQLANPRMHIRKRIAGNEFYVQKISVAVPITGPATVELVPIPPRLRG